MRNNMFGIKLNTTEEKEKFVDIVSQYDCDIILKHGSRMVDAKSLLGVMAINTSSDCYVITSDDNFQKELMYKVSEFLV